MQQQLLLLVPLLLLLPLLCVRMTQVALRPRTALKVVVALRGDSYRPMPHGLHAMRHAGCANDANTSRLQWNAYASIVRHVIQPALAREQEVSILGALYDCPLDESFCQHFAGVDSTCSRIKVIRQAGNFGQQSTTLQTLQHIGRHYSTYDVVVLLRPDITISRDVTVGPEWRASVGVAWRHNEGLSRHWPDQAFVIGRFALETFAASLTQFDSKHTESPGTLHDFMNHVEAAVNASRSLNIRFLWPDCDGLPGNSAARSVRFNQSRNCGLNECHKAHGPTGNPFCPGPFEHGTTNVASTTLPLTGAAEGHAGKLFWFHAPKCGTSFINALYGLACPRAYCCTGNAPVLRNTSYGDNELFSRAPPNKSCDVVLTGLAAHSPYHGASRDGRAMGFFRDPTSRIASAFVYYKQQGKFGLDSLEHYARHTRGCQTKMVLGWPMGTRCGYQSNSSVWQVARRAPSKDEMALAVQRVREDFAFAGLTAEWELSIRLFHAQHGGEVARGELINMRPTGEASQYHDALRQLRQMAYSDPHDEALFAAVQEEFYARVRAHGLLEKKV